MVLTYLRSLLRGRNLLRTNLAVKNAVISVNAANIMERIAVRCVEGDEFMTLSFAYGNKHNNLLRSKNETIERSLERIKASVRKAEKKGNKKIKFNNKKLKMDPQNSAGSGSSSGCVAQQQEAEDILCVLSAEAMVEGEQAGGDQTLIGIEPSTCNKDAWIEGSILQVRDSLYRVSRNMPTMLGLRLPNKIMAGCPVHPRIEMEFAQFDCCEYTWHLGSKVDVSKASLLRGSGKKVEALTKVSQTQSTDAASTNTSNNNDVTMGTQSTDASSVPMETNATHKSLVTKIKAIERVWSLVSKNRVFTPTEAMLGCMLRLECKPVDEAKREGEMKMVSSSCEVTASPKAFPFEKRHEYTKEKTQDGR